MDGQSTWYAVQKGTKPGVYLTWNECKLVTYGFRGAKFKKFDNKQDAEDYSKGIVNRHDPDEEAKHQWKKTESERFWDVLHDSSNQTKPEQRGQEEKETIEPPPQNDIPKSTVCVKERIDVWVYGCPDGMGSFAVYFGPDDDRNSSGLYCWSKPISKTRTGIAACIRAISVVSKSRSKEQNGTKEPIGLTFRSDSKYLCRSLMKWITCWSRRKVIGVADERDKDLYKFIRTQLKGSNIKISVVEETNEKCENIQIVSSMASNHVIKNNS